MKSLFECDFGPVLNWNLTHLEFVIEMQRNTQLSEKTWNGKIPIE